MSISSKDSQHKLSQDATLDNLRRVSESLCTALSLAYPELETKERTADSSAGQRALPADLIALEKLSSELAGTHDGRDNQIYVEVPGILLSGDTRPKIPISEALSSFIDLARAIVNDDLPAGQSPGLTLRALTELAGSIERHADKIADLRIAQESAVENSDQSQNTAVEPSDLLPDDILDPEDENVLVVPKPHNEPISEPDLPQELGTAPGPVIRAMREIVEFVRNKTIESATIAARALGIACKGIIKVLAKHLEIVHIPIQLTINPNLKGLIIGCAFAISTGLLKRLINGKIPTDALGRSWAGGQASSSYSLTFETGGGEAGKAYQVGDVSGPGMGKFQDSLATTVVRFLEPGGSKLSSLFDNLTFVWGPRAVDLWYPRCVNLDKELDRIKAHSVKICLPLNVSKNNEKPIYLPLPMGWQVHFLSLEGNQNNSSDLSIRAGVLGGLVLEGVSGATRVRYQISPKEESDPVTPEMLFYLEFFTPEALFSQGQRDGTNPSSAIQSASQQEIVDACAGLMWLEGYRYSLDPWIGSLCQAAKDDSLQVAQILKYGKCDALAAALASKINQNGVVSLVATGLVLARDSEGDVEAAFDGTAGHAVTLAVGISEAQESFLKEIDLTKMVSNKQLPSALIDDWRRGELLLKMRRASTTEARLAVAKEALIDLRLYGEHGCGVEPPGLSRVRVNKAIGSFILPTHPGYRRDRRFVSFTDTPGPLPQELALSLVGEELALRIESIVSDASKANWTETDWQRHLASLSFISQALEASESFTESVRNRVFNAASALLSRCEQEIELLPADDFHIRITYLNLFVKVGHKTWSNDPFTENIGFYTKPDPRSLAKLLTRENIEHLTKEQVSSLAKLLPKLPLEVLGPQILEIYQVVRTLYGAVNLSNSTDPTLEDVGSRLIMTALRDCNTRQFENIQTELLQEGFEWLLKSTEWTDRIQDSSAVNEILDAFIYAHKISLLEDIEWCFISCLADTIGTRDYLNRLESSPRDNPAMSASTRAAVERIKDRTALRAQSWIDRLVSRVDLAMAKGQDINARRIAELLNELPEELADRFMHRLHNVAYDALLKNNQIFTSLVLELDNVSPVSWSEPLTALYLQGLYEGHPTIIWLIDGSSG